MRFFQAVGEGRDTDAILGLRQLLLLNPFFIHDPVAAEVVRHLFTVFTHQEGEAADTFMRSAEGHLDQLAIAWASAITRGRVVLKSHSVPKRSTSGRAPSLFPFLDENRGWEPTARSLVAHSDASRLVSLYRDLLERLKTVPWRDIAPKVRRRRENRAALGAFLEQKALPDLVLRVFQGFLSAQGVATRRSVGRDDIKSALNTTLTRRDRHRERTAEALLALLHLRDYAGRVLALDSSLVRSTLSTLRRRGFMRPGGPFAK